MSREIELHRVDIWNRATIADGKKLQATTIRPLSANDVILAEAISGYKKELQDYYDNEYTKLTTVIAPDITKWNGTTMNVYMNLDSWNRTYDAVQNSGYKWNSAYNVLGASANIWNSTVGSACSGAAASGWLSVNELPNSDHITDFNALRPAAETDDHYKRFGETSIHGGVVVDPETGKSEQPVLYTTRIVGPSTLSLTTHSAWKYDESTTPPTPIINIGDDFFHVSGSNNFCILPGCVQSVDGTHSMVTHCRNYHVSGLFDSIYIGMLGNLAKTQNIQAIPSTDYSHFDTENSLLFIKGGCEDFKNSLSLAALSTIGITNSFTRGGMTQNVKNSLSVGYCTKEGGNIYNGDELYNIFDSLTNFKGRTLGTHNSLTIKGTVSGTKGISSPAHYVKNTYDVGFYNSHTNYFGGNGGYQHASALWNSVEHIYDCGSSPSAEMVNTYYFNKNGYIEQDSNEAYFNNSFITLNSGNILKQSIENSLVKIKNIILDTRYVKQCYLDTSACDIGRGSTYDDSYIKSNNVYFGDGSYVKQSLLYNYSAMSLMAGATNSDRSLIYNMYNTYIGPSYFQNSFIFRLSGGNGGGAGHFTNYGHNRCVNNFIDLVVPEAFNSEGLNYNTLGAEMLENSYIRTNFKARYGYAVTNFKYKNSFVNYDGVYTDGVFPGGDYQNNRPFFLLCTNTSAHSKLSSPSTFSVPNLLVLKDSKLTQGGLFTIGEKINLQYPYYGRKATKFIMGSNFTNTVNEGHNSLDDFFIFGNNNHYIDERDYPGYVHFGNNMNLSDNAIYKKLTSKLKTLQLQNSLFVVSNDEGPFFMVFGNIDSDIDGNVFYYKKSEDAWYNIKTKTKL